MGWTALILANWDVILILAVVLVYLFVRLGLYLTKPSEEKQKLMLEWLSQAVRVAEERFGSKAGKEKLAYVYHQFVKKHGVLSFLISEKTFNELVDKALVDMDKALDEKLGKEQASLFDRIEAIEKLEQERGDK